MYIRVRLTSLTENEVEWVLPDYRLTTIWPKRGDAAFPLLGWLDEYGVMRFNNVQMKPLLLELESLRDSHTELEIRTFLQSVIDLVLTRVGRAHYFVDFHGQ